jgi:hypothetical protein
LSDLNGDGNLDLAIGSPQITSGSNSTSSFFILLGAAYSGVISRSAATVFKVVRPPVGSSSPFTDSNLADYFRRRRITNSQT